MTAPRLLHVGSIVVDHVYRIDALPAPGTEVTAQSYQVLPGGGFNLIVAAKRAGLAVAFGGAHGTGVNGDLVRAALKAEGIEILTAPSASMDSGVCTVLVTRDAERSFVSWPGAEGQPHAARLEAGAGDWIFASGYTLSYPESGHSVAEKVVRLARGNPLIFDPTPVVAEIPRPILAAVLRTTRWLSCNEDEANVIVGDASDPSAALLEEHCPAAEGVIIRAGENGCRLRLRGESETVIPGFKVEAVDTNGAGDTHIGAFVAALAHGSTPLEAARFANAAAAIAVTRHGGAAGPNRTEIEEFLTKQACSPVLN